MKSYTLAGLAVYVALNVIDFIATYALLRRSGGRVYESNPLAASWLESYGWEGLAVFKAVTILVVATIVLFVRRRRPHTAAGLVTVACLIVLGVVLYSHNLLVR